jgi:hypothetical protein
VCGGRGLGVEGGVGVGGANAETADAETNCDKTVHDVKRIAPNNCEVANRVHHLYRASVYVTLVTKTMRGHVTHK